MKARTFSFAVILTLVISLNSAFAFNGATVPWITYEAENGTYTGTLLGPTYSPNVVSSEASGRECIQLSSTGQYVQFTAVSNANSIIVRYSVPDTSDGVGADYTIGLYKNGTLVGRLPVTSRYSWLYGSYPFSNTPSQGSPRNFFDEVRTNGVSISAGDVIKLQKDSADTASYYVIDLVDLENVPAAISQPNGFVSIKNYGAVGDGSNDDTLALQNCINNNNFVWIPPGNYKITSQININSSKTIWGAGMWYSTLVGDATVYTNSSRRITMFGRGDGIQLSDFAIVGKLRYRNDSEPNDGLGGSYGTGSSITDIWVEHTKTGAWIVNSQGLVVKNCRFRDTIADGINLAVGMQATTVTNCTARGTGDDCFPIWPATYLSQNYTPGQNVITHCTGQVPFLANGGAIYGGVSNTIEDCLFQDIPYGCGILISTTFPVGGNIFSGTTVAQRCDVIRCGGYDPGYQWRAAVQLTLDTYSGGITGVNLNNLNISNSVSDGLSVIGGNGTLSGAIMSNVSIPNYGLGTSGRNGLWARSDARGSMTVSNCTVAEYLDASANFTFNFVTTPTRLISLSGNLGFGNVTVGSSTNGTLTINNTGNSTLTVSSVTYPNGFSGTWTGAIPSGGSTNLTVTFSPLVATNYAGNLTVNSDATGGVNTLAVSGTGVSTNGAPQNLATLAISVNPDSSVTLLYATTPGFAYHVEVSTNLTPASWTTLPGSATNATGNSVIFTDTNAPGNVQLFYRVGSP